MTNDTIAAVASAVKHGLGSDSGEWVVAEWLRRRTLELVILGSIPAVRALEIDPI